MSVAAATTEEGRLYSWRLDQLQRLGYSTSEAADLAYLPIDLHELARLIKNGCTTELARAILT